MKRCSNCKTEKDNSSFNKKGRGFSSYCQDCNKNHLKQDYVNKKASYKERTNKRRNQLAAINFPLYIDYLKTHPCVDCGEVDPIVLQFDHIRDKKFLVSKMIHSYDWDQILTEISKCEIRCANCHIRRTAKQFNWYVKYGVVV